jgi:hypothetical protein
MFRLPGMKFCQRNSIFNYKSDRVCPVLGVWLFKMMFYRIRVKNICSEKFLLYHLLFPTYLSQSLFRILGAILTAGHLVQLLPAILGYFDGFLGNFIDSKTLFIILVIAISLKNLTFCFLVIYRYAMGVPGKLQDFLLEKKNLYFAYFGTISISFFPLLIFFVPLEVSFSYFSCLIREHYFNFPVSSGILDHVEQFCQKIFCFLKTGKNNWTLGGFEPATFYIKFFKA